MTTIRVRRALILLLLATLGATGCRAPVYLMPTPEVFRDERFDIFANSPDLERLDQVTTFFASKRRPKKPGDPAVFSMNPADVLTVGRLTFQIGERDGGSQNLHAQSTTSERLSDFELSMIDARLDATIDVASADPAQGPVQGEGGDFFEQLNAAIVASPFQELTIFVHGANNSFVESVARGANYQYFTGNQAVVLTFAWPSAGSVFGYAYDVRTAERSPQDLAAFIELAARHTEAKRINIIGYSAGGRVASGALAALAARYPGADGASASALRLGQVYMASSDEPLTDFLDRLPTYVHLIEAVTVMTEPDDTVLGLASLVDGRLRLGSPPENAGEVLGLSESDHAQLTEWTNSSKLVILNLQINEIDGFEYSHSAWYENPWISTDVLITLNLGFPPEGRGLKSYEGSYDRPIWYFPADYLDSLKAILLEYFAE